MQSGENRLITDYYVIETVCCLLLLVLFCARIWDLGITTTDDGTWAVLIHQADQHPILDFARDQGRLWGFAGGGWIALGLWFNGTWLGNAFIVGGFLLFFALFVRVISAYWSASVAFTAAGLFLALFALRADRSILYSYPLFFWIPASAVIVAMLLARQFQRDGGWGRLCSSSALLLLGLFNNEGASVLTLVLFASALLTNYVQVKGREGNPARAIQRLRWNVGVHAIVGAAFVAASVAWRLVHPSAYSGNTLAPFDAGKIIATLFSFSTSGTILYDLAHPYVQTFSDAVLSRSVKGVYEPTRYFDGAVTNPTSLVTGALAACLMVRALSRQIVADRPLHRRALGAGVVIGLVIALLPLLPVAMTSQYQGWFYQYDAHAYSHTVFATFGWALTAASLCGMLMTTRGISAPGRYGAASLIAIVLGLCAMAGHQMNDAIARDLRPESARWHVVDALAGMTATLGHPADMVAVPRLRSGTWFATMPPEYWSDYAQKVLGSDMRVSDRGLTMTDVARGAGYADYQLNRDGRTVTITLAHVVLARGTTAAPFADQLTVLVEGPTDPATPDRLLAFEDLHHGLHQIPLHDMTALGGELWTIKDIQAVPASARVIDQSVTAGLEIDYGGSVPLGVPLIASRLMPAGPGFPLNLQYDRGWSPAEAAGTWSLGRTATIDLPYDGTPPSKLRLDIDASSYTGLGFYDALQTVRLRIKGRLAATWEFRPGRGPLPPIDVGANDWSASQSGQTLSLDFEIDPPYQPKRLGLAPDERELGLLLRSITLHPLVDPAP